MSFFNRNKSWQRKYTQIWHLQFEWILQAASYLHKQKDQQKGHGMWKTNSRLHEEHDQRNLFLLVWHFACTHELFLILGWVHKKMLALMCFVLVFYSFSLSFIPFLPHFPSFLFLCYMTGNCHSFIFSIHFIATVDPVYVQGTLNVLLGKPHTFTHLFTSKGNLESLSHLQYQQVFVTL